MLIKILVALAVIVLGFVGVVAMRPSEYRVARTATIAAPAPAVFAQVNDFHKWEAWNPWAKLDPAMKQAYEGAPAGIGAIYTWSGNNEVGEGRMTLTESRPSDLVRIRLEFLKPFATTSTAEFSFKPEGDHTAVTWSMAGKVNFMAKVVHLFMDMDRMIGGNFEKGLAHRLLPELAHRKVLKRLDGPLDDTVPANRPITVRALLPFLPHGLRHRHGTAGHVSDPNGDERAAPRPGTAEAADAAGAG